MSRSKPFRFREECGANHLSVGPAIYLIAKAFRSRLRIRTSPAGMQNSGVSAGSREGIEVVPAMPLKSPGPDPGPAWAWTPTTDTPAAPGG